MKLLHMLAEAHLADAMVPVLGLGLPRIAHGVAHDLVVSKDAHEVRVVSSSKA
jgi:hypothetical protein